MCQLDCLVSQFGGTIGIFFGISLMEFIFALEWTLSATFAMSAKKKMEDIFEAGCIRIILQDQQNAKNDNLALDPRRPLLKEERPTLVSHFPEFLIMQRGT